MSGKSASIRSVMLFTAVAVVAIILTIFILPSPPIHSDGRLVDQIKGHQATMDTLRQEMADSFPRVLATHIMDEPHFHEIIANQETIIANQERILDNHGRILSGLNRMAAHQARMESQQRALAVLGERNAARILRTLCWSSQNADVECRANRRSPP